MTELNAILVTLSSVAVGLVLIGSLMTVLIPFSLKLEARLEKSEHPQLVFINLHLTQQIDRGDIQVDSPEYWKAIEAMSELTGDVLGRF